MVKKSWYLSCGMMLHNICILCTCPKYDLFSRYLNTLPLSLNIASLFVTQSYSFPFIRLRNFLNPQNYSWSRTIMPEVRIRFQSDPDSCHFYSSEMTVFEKNYFFNSQQRLNGHLCYCYCYWAIFVFDSECSAITDKTLRKKLYPKIFSGRVC